MAVQFFTDAAFWKYRVPASGNPGTLHNDPNASGIFYINAEKLEFQIQYQPATAAETTYHTAWYYDGVLVSTSTGTIPQQAAQSTAVVQQHPRANAFPGGTYSQATVDRMGMVVRDTNATGTVRLAWGVITNDTYKYPSLPIQDTFNRANATLHGSTTSDGKATWTVITGGGSNLRSASVFSNRARSDFAGGQTMPYVNTGSTDQDVTVEIHGVPGATDTGFSGPMLCVNGPDPGADAYHLYYDRLNSRLYLRRSGPNLSEPWSKTFPFTTSASPITLRLKKLGNVLTAYANGVEYGTYTDTSPLTHTNAGFRVDTGEADNFNAVSSVPAVPSGLTASDDQAGQVTVAWSPGGYSLFEVERDSVKIADDNASPYVDVVAPGTYTYRVRGYTTEGANPAAPASFSDDFNRSNRALGGDNGWTTLGSGGFSIVSNRAVGGSSGQSALHSSNGGATHKNHDVAFDADFTASNYIGMFLNRKDYVQGDRAGFLVRVISGALSILTLADGSVTNNHNTGVTVSPGTKRFRATSVQSGANHIITVYIDGTQVAQHTTVTPTGIAEVVGFYTDNNTSTIDNFAVTATDPSATRTYSAYSNTDSGTSLNSGPPTPTGLTASDGRVREIFVDWSGPAGTYLGDEVDSGYELFRDGVLFATIVETDYLDTGRANGASHVYKARYFRHDTTTGAAPFTDAFTRADSTTTIGGGWTNFGQLWGIVSNQAYRPGGQSGNFVGNVLSGILRDAGTKLADFSFDVTQGSTWNTYFPLFMSADAQTGLYIMFSPNSSGDAHPIFGRIIGGLVDGNSTGQTSAGTINLAPGTTKNFRFVCTRLDASTVAVQIKVNGADYGPPINFLDSQMGGTYFGAALNRNTVDTGHRFDNASVADPAVTTTTRTRVTSADSNSDTGTTLALPNAPVLSGTAGDKQNSLTWTNPTGVEDGFRLYRDSVLVYEGTALSRVDLVALNEITYRYQVASYNAAGEAYSNEVALTPRFVTVAPAVAKAAFSPHLRDLWMKHILSRTTHVRAGDSGSLVPVTLELNSGLLTNRQAFTLPTGNVIIQGLSSTGQVLWKTETAKPGGVVPVHELAVYLET